VPGREFHPLDVAIQPNGKILVLGVGNSYYKIWIARLTPRGRVDRRYGNDGFANAFLLGSVEESLGGITSDHSGRAVVVTGEPDGWIRVRRYTRAGWLDRSFSGDGSAWVRFRVHTVRAGDPLADRGIVAGGFAWGYENDSVLALARLGPGGELDSSFGGDGRVVRHFCCQAFASEIGVDGSGRVVVGGLRGSAGQTSLVRVLPDGRIDTAFSGDGQLVLPSGMANLKDVGVAEDGVTQ